VALLVVAALLSLAWDMAVPAFQGPDESRHFSYVQHLAETGETPSVKGGTSNSTEEQDALIWLNLEPLVGNTLARPAWSTADLSLWHRIERSMPRGSRVNAIKLPAADPQANNPPLYYAAMSIPYRVFVWLPLLKRVFVLRLINALCYLATIALMWLIAGELFGPVRWKQTLAAGVVALEPQLSFLSAIINADNLLIALTTGLLLVALRLVTRGPSMARVLAASVLAAAAVLTLGRGLVTLPVLAVALVVAWIVHRPATRDALTRGAAAVATIVVAFVAYVLFGRASGTSSLYGGQLSQLNSRVPGGASFTIRQFLYSIYQFYFQTLARLRPRIGPEFGYNQVFIKTFYGAFGSLEVVFKTAVYNALKILSDVGLLALLTACVVRWRRLWQAWPVVVVMLALLLTNVVFLHYVSFRALLNNGGTGPLIVGRYLLPMVGLFGLAITFVAGSLPRRAGPLLAALILAVGVLLCLAGIGITAVRFYA
jgi:4-amino-4-deoxy-L-arabinose transferase-like glycosyltransferase